MKKTSLVVLALLSILPTPSFASEPARAEAALDAKVGLLKHKWRIMKLAPLYSLTLPKQLRFGLPPVEQQVLPAALVLTLNLPPSSLSTVPSQVPATTPSLSTVVPTSGPTCKTITTPNGTFKICTP
jgi:hypothetical protein